MNGFGDRLTAAIALRGPLCLGIDPHPELLRAWGLGVDRMAMVALGIEDIRDLFSTDLDFIRAQH